MKNLLAVLLAASFALAAPLTASAGFLTMCDPGHPYYDDCDGPGGGTGDCVDWYYDSSEVSWHDYGRVYDGNSKGVTFDLVLDSVDSHCVCSFAFVCDETYCDDYPCYSSEWSLDYSQFPEITITFTPDYGTYGDGHRQVEVYVYFQITGDEDNHWWEKGICLEAECKPGGLGQN